MRDLAVIQADFRMRGIGARAGVRKTSVFGIGVIQADFWIRVIEG